MRWYSYSINDDQTQPDIATGKVQALSVADALAKIGDKRANVYELPMDVGEGYSATDNS